MEQKFLQDGLKGIRVKSSQYGLVRAFHILSMYVIRLNSSCFNILRNFDIVFEMCLR